MTAIATQPMPAPADFMQYFIDMIAEAVAQKLRMNEPTKRTNEPNNEPKTRVSGIRGIAQYLKCSTATVQRLKDDGSIPVYGIGKRFYAYGSELDQALKTN